MNLVTLSRDGRRVGPRAVEGKVLLLKPPYFSPWTPPLGIGILKSFLQEHGYPAQCFDFNTDPDLWGMHHKYFGAVQTLEDVSINDGYSKLWWILNAHMLAYANGATPEQCANVLETIIPRYGIRADDGVIGALIPLVDRFYRRLGEVADGLDLGGFAVVGTSTYTTSLGPSLFLLKHVKRRFPHVRTVMGGGVFADDLALESDNLDTLVREYDCVDHVILGEGEMLLLKLLEGEFGDKRVISIADLKGQTLQMKDVPVPDFSDTEPENYYHLSIEGARSCPFQCSFCSETIQWGDYRKKPTEQFAEQVVELARRYQNNSFFMGDSLMNPYINPFAARLKELDANVLYDGYLRADKPVTNRKFVQMWAESGCYRVRLGIESAAARVLESMDKMTTPKVISGVLKTLANAGIRTTTYWIVGFPGETEEDFDETCEFIREHHRFIYELEAHPYYYYPYGQIGSRLHQCYSLYPEEVTDVIKFKVWDIIDANPTREVRYRRLRRISKLASDLGLPNIYTMSERYAAERRWHSLYPTAIEVYEGTRVGREAPRTTAQTLPIFSGDALGLAAREGGGAEQVLCYRVACATRLDGDVLREALATLVRYHEMLQVSARGGAYVAEPENSGDASRMLRIYEGGAAEDAARRAREIAEELAVQMRPAPFDSLRAALVDGAGDGCELLVLLHRSVADGRGLVIICEDLMRVYEQLSSRKEVALRTVEKSYADFVNEPGAKARVARDARPVREPDPARSVTSEVVELRAELGASILSDARFNFNLAPSGVVLTALRRTLSRCEAARRFRIDVTADYRDADASLCDTMAALTLVRPLPATPPADPRFPAAAHELRSRLRDELSTVEQTNEAAPSPFDSALINLEQLEEEPWLGGAQYTPLGFVNLTDGPRPPYALELTPALSGEGMTLRLKYADSEELKPLVREIAGVFPEELEAVLAEGERYAAAREFWHAELELGSPQPNTDALAGDGLRDGGGRWLSVRCGVSREAVELAAAQCGTDSDTVLLSALGVLLSRLNGRRRVDVLEVFEGGVHASPLPLRLDAGWATGFDEFARGVGSKAELARRHGEYVSEFADGASALSKNAPYDIDVAYLRGPSPEGGRDYEALRDLPLGRALAFALSAGAGDEASSVRLHGDTSRLSLPTLEKMSSYLEAIITEVGSNAGVALGDIALDRAAHVVDPSLTLARDAFSFN